MSQTITLTLQDVHIHSARGKDVITVQVPEHEIDVLKVIHGETNLQVQGPVVGDDDEIELPANAQSELLRLQNKYRQNGQADPVRYAFPGGAKDIAALGFDAKGATEAAPQASVRKHAKPKAEKPKAAK